MTLRVVIVGAGPAGALLARALQVRGVEPVLIDTEASGWSATYGAWCDEVADACAALGIESPWRRTWSTTRIVAGRELLMARPYGVFDNDVLRSTCIEGIEFVTGRVESMEQGVDDAIVRVADGSELRADVVVDARGAVGVGLAPGSDVGVQTAYGVVVPVRELVQRDLGGDVMTLMDWSATTTAMPPTFLYAMQLSDEEGLVEETSLCARPPYEHAELRQRLTVRMGNDLTVSASSVEVVHIPMSQATPPHRVDVLRFGAAAGLVHPVTGYSVAASMRLAVRMADVLVAGCASGIAGAALRDAAWADLWNSDMRRVRALHRLGVRITERLDAGQTADFFATFFGLAPEIWAPYLRIDASPADVRRAMFGVFSAGSLSLKRRLMSYPGELVRALAAR